MIQSEAVPCATTSTPPRYHPRESSLPSSIHATSLSLVSLHDTQTRIVQPLNMTGSNARVAPPSPLATSVLVKKSNAGDHPPMDADARISFKCSGTDFVPMRGLPVSQSRGENPASLPPVMLSRQHAGNRQGPQYAADERRVAPANRRVQNGFPSVKGVSDIFSHAAVKRKFLSEYSLTRQPRPLPALTRSRHSPKYVEPPRSNDRSPRARRWGALDMSNSYRHLAEASPPSVPTLQPDVSMTTNHKGISGHEEDSSVMSRGRATADGQRIGHPTATVRVVVPHLSPIGTESPLSNKPHSVVPTAHRDHPTMSTSKSDEALTAGAPTIAVPEAHAKGQPKGVDGPGTDGSTTAAASTAGALLRQSPRVPPVSLTHLLAGNGPQDGEADRVVFARPQMDRKQLEDVRPNDGDGESRLSLTPPREGSHPPTLTIAIPPVPVSGDANSNIGVSSPESDDRGLTHGNLEEGDGSRDTDLDLNSVAASPPQLSDLQRPSERTTKYEGGATQGGARLPIVPRSATKNTALVVAADDTATRCVFDRYETALKTLNDIIGQGANAMMESVKTHAELSRILAETWTHIATTRLAEFAHQSFSIVLQRHPEYASFFKSMDVREESKVMFEMIGRAVCAFSNPDMLIDLMTELGARHRYYLVYHEHFTALRDAFLTVYPQYVTPAMGADSIHVWQLFWRTIIKLLVGGSTSARGEYYEQKRLTDFNERMVRAADVLEVKQRAPPESDRRHLFVHVMTQFIQSEYPAKQITYFKANDDGPAADDNPTEIEHGTEQSDYAAMDRDFQSMLTIIRNYGKGLQSNVEIMDQVLHHHLGRGLQFSDILLYKNAFMKTWEHFLRGDRVWNPLLQKSIGECWDSAVAHWTHQLAAVAAVMRTTNAPDAKTPMCLIFTDIEASTRLWEKDSKVMDAAVRHHHSLIRGIARDYDGYEVKTVGDSFMIATKDALSALKIAVMIQLELMRRPIAKGFEMIWSTQGGGNPACWRRDSLRVRIGIHYCTELVAIFDSTNLRCDYYGPSVNMAARVESQAYGGQILMTKETLDALEAIPSYRDVPAPKNMRGFRRAAPLAVDPLMLENAGSSSTERDSITQSVGEDTERCTELSSQVSPDTKQHQPSMSELVQITDMGMVPLKGIVHLVQLVSVLPISLVGRTFEPEEEMVVI